MPERIQQLSAAMAGGDADAVDTFYREYFDFLYTQARRCTRRDESFCLDVVQDAVLRIIRTVKSVDSEARFRGWLKLVVQTTAFDLLRSERRRKNREAMAATLGSSTVDSEVDALQLDWLVEQISKLDPEIVRIIELRFEQRWTLRKIGQTLGISIGAVDGRLRRALRKLQLSGEHEASAECPVVPEETSVAKPIEAELSPGLPLQRQVLAAETASPVRIISVPELPEAASPVGICSVPHLPRVGSEISVDLQDEAGAYDSWL